MKSTVETQKASTADSTKPKRCSVMVPGEGSWGSFHMHNCRRPVKTEREGKYYCTVHDPENEKLRREKLHAKWDAKSKARRKAELPRLYAHEMLALLTESQTSIEGDWRERRDALLRKINGDGE